MKQYNKFRENFRIWLEEQKPKRIHISYPSYLNTVDNILKSEYNYDFIEDYIIKKRKQANEVLTALVSDLKEKCSKNNGYLLGYNYKQIQNRCSALNKYAEFLESNNYFNNPNDKQYKIRARIALPCLVRYAKARRKICYSKLAELIGMPNPRNLNMVLAEIGYILSKLDRNIPIIQSIVVSKTTGLPSTGLSEFIKGYDKMTNKEKRIIFEIEREKVFEYDKWNAVLRDLGLESIIFDIEDEVSKIRSGKYGKGGEGELHKTMKEIISKYPYVIGLSESATLISKEYTLWSADCVDIMFEYKKGRTKTAIAIEVKASNSDSADIFRGLFQCIKYKSIMQAMNKIENTYSDFRVILALENELPIEYYEIRDILEIEVIDSLNSNKEYLKKYK